MRVEVVADAEALATEGARRVVAVAREASAEKGECSLVLTGGSTPRRLYELLATDPFRSEMPWEAIDWFWGDERCVPPDDPRSNFRLAREALLARVPVDRERVHRMEGETPRDRAAMAYEGVIRSIVPDGGFDLVLLGVGEDGHTASLFPGHPALRERERWVLGVHAEGADPVADRITMTFPLLNRARSVLVLASGSAKRPIVTAVRRDPREAARHYPAACMQGPAISWLVDAAAA
jgi:6-phosphogluconolactonase